MVIPAKSGISFAYQNAGSVLADCQSMIFVIADGFSSETNMFPLCRSGWNNVGADAFWIRRSDDIALRTARACPRSWTCDSTVPW